MKAIISSIDQQLITLKISAIQSRIDTNDNNHIIIKELTLAMSEVAMTWSQSIFTVEINFNNNIQRLFINTYSTLH